MLPAGECRALPTITAGKSARAPQRGFWGLLGAAGEWSGVEWGGIRGAEVGGSLRPLGGYFRRQATAGLQRDPARHRWSGG